jgi:dihydroxyacetone kinase
MKVVCINYLSRFAIFLLTKKKTTTNLKNKQIKPASVLIGKFATLQQMPG